MYGVRHIRLNVQRFGWFCSHHSDQRMLGVVGSHELMKSDKSSRCWTSSLACLQLWSIQHKASTPSVVSFFVPESGVVWNIFNHLRLDNGLDTIIGRLSPWWVLIALCVMEQILQCRGSNHGQDDEGMVSSLSSLNGLLLWFTLFHLSIKRWKWTTITASVTVKFSHAKYFLWCMCTISDDLIACFPCADCVMYSLYAGCVSA